MVPEIVTIAQSAVSRAGNKSALQNVGRQSAIVAF